MSISELQAEVERLKASEKDLIDDLYECFEQACGSWDRYDHMCISTYERLQRFLIEKGRITKDQCLRP